MNHIGATGEVRAAGGNGGVPLQHWSHEEFGEGGRIHATAHRVPLRSPGRGEVPVCFWS